MISLFTEVVLCANSAQNIQFDEWRDIKEDIEDNFDDCCCKEVLFEELHITNEDQKRFEYLRLKYCLKSLRMSAKLDEIHRTFTHIFNEQTAISIAQSFDLIVEKETFVNVDEMQSSQILRCIIDNIDFSMCLQQKERAQNIIATGLKFIFEDRTEEFIKHNEPRSKQELSTGATQQNSQRIDASKLNDIHRAFTKVFTEEIAVSIVKLFTAVVEEEFGDLDDIKDDIEDRESSEIIKYILDNLNYDQFSQNRENVQNIIANGFEYIFENKTEEFIQQSQSTSNAIQSSDDDDGNTKQFDPSIMALTNRLNEHFADNAQIVESFWDYILKEGFDLEMIQEDIAEIEESAILDYIMEHAAQQQENTNSMDKPLTMQMIQRKIQQAITEQAQGIQIVTIAQKSPSPMEYKEENESNIAEIHRIHQRIKEQIQKEYDERIAALISNKINALIKRECVRLYLYFIFHPISQFE